jgi:hypothetical protein
MTGLELLQALQGLNEQQLSFLAVIAHPDGGYDSISHLSVTRIGHPVIHIQERAPIREGLRGTLVRMNPSV